MNLLNDEILNKYIDGELEPSIIQKVNEMLKSSEEYQKRLKALQLVHEGLKNITGIKTSPNFTFVVMAKIKSRMKKKKNDIYFIYSITSILISICLIITGFVLSNINLTTKTTSRLTHIMNTYLNYIIFFNDKMKDILNPNIILMFGSITTFGIIITAYLFYENHKRTQTELNKIR